MVHQLVYEHEYSHPQLPCAVESQIFTNAANLWYKQAPHLSILRLNVSTA